ncbi:hypothetical protein HPB50_020156 [Hyalomma asiaticum]|uniref:Uncharacterized protein n=1 Tax=Hyalomma asiaticum TaxID=266040 RepID=A0ACB7TN65_HYAAI|nr:hypothetical protein HPB50_020156 [Hyalomma asiaticum]
MELPSEMRWKGPRQFQLYSTGAPPLHPIKRRVKATHYPPRREVAGDTRNGSSIAAHAPRVFIIGDSFAANEHCRTQRQECSRSRPDGKLTIKMSADMALTEDEESSTRLIVSLPAPARN